MAKKKGPAFQAWYEMRKPEAASTAGALSLDTPVSTLDVSGTTDYTLAAPKFANQLKTITQLSGASSPVGTVTVTGMRISSQNVFSGFDRTTAQLDSAPRSMTLHSPDGLVWDIRTLVNITVA